MKMKMDKKIAFAVLFAIMFLMSPMLSAVQAGDADVSGWYRETDGVLSSDYFYLYPYAASDLKVGFSKYGEKINPYAGVGLQYNGPVTDSATTTGADPFANPGVPMDEWVDGWWLAFTYQHRTLGWRTLWAWALFSDFVEWGSPSDGSYLKTSAVAPGAKVEGGWVRLQRDTGPSQAAGLQPHGGRKTNARVVTDDVQVLYNGPREYIALLSSTLYDSSVVPITGGFDPDEGPGIAVLKINILIEFNKVKKEVIQKKDVKLLIDEKTLVGDKAYLEFSNRGQWDLGTTEHYRSYAHFYTLQGDSDPLNEGLETVYGKDYHKASLHDWHWETDQTIDTADCTGYGMQWPGMYGYDLMTEPWGFYAKAQMISDYAPYVGWASFWPHPSYWTVDGFEHAWDKLGIVIDGWDAAWHSGAAPGHRWRVIAGINDELDPPQAREDDMVAPKTEPEIPFVIGEWEFVFSISRDITQFRGITVYGVTDWHDGWDADISGSNKIDREVLFQNDEIFNPFDLNDAVHKQTERDVYIETLSAELTKDTYYGFFSLPAPRLQPVGTGIARWAMGHYYTSGNVRCSYTHLESKYSVHLSSTGTGTSDGGLIRMATHNLALADITSVSQITFWALWASPIFSYDGGNPYVNIVLYVPGNPGLGWDGTRHMEGIGTTGVTDVPVTDVWTQMKPTDQFYSSDGDEAVGWEGAGNWHTLADWKVLYPTAKVVQIDIYFGLWSTNNQHVFIDDINIPGWTGATRRVMYDGSLKQVVTTDWWLYSKFPEKVEVDTGTGYKVIQRLGGYGRTGLDSGATEPTVTVAMFDTTFPNYGYGYTLDLVRGKIKFYKISAGAVVAWTLPAGTKVKVLFSTMSISTTSSATSTASDYCGDAIEGPLPGAYEWDVVGAESQPIDSAGAAMVSEAFDSLKDIRVIMAGLDIMEDIYGPKAPYVFHPFEASPTTRANYRDTIGRAALLDDFCTTNAISSSNIIGVGGPLANLEAEYLNDFTPVFYGMSDSFHTTHEDYAGKIIAGECWSRNAYANTATLGYAAISVYKDINGTVNLVVWGWSGQDTYYATLWLWSTVIAWRLQTDSTYTTKTGTPGIVYLQGENPGVVSIILKFDYTKHYTTSGFGTLIERLGTISEKTPHQDP